jgi:hypothetical protein
MENKWLGCVGMVVLAVLAITGSAVMNGWALSVMWGWFVVPTFGVPPLSIPAAIGFSMVVGMLTRQTSTNSSEKETTVSQVGVVAYAIVGPILVVCMGYVVKLFM